MVEGGGIVIAAYVACWRKIAEAGHIGSEGCHGRQPERSGDNSPAFNQTVYEGSRLLKKTHESSCPFSHNI
ncbi:MAG: hypothetical protein JRJ12_04790 [Deltaproteobacteria bacterium]|nr:hypothetical protein [Deltaproteobacteria bacterium]MBW2072067.1 hypothetical protein [Deltaproteobacteria bacterium]